MKVAILLTGQERTLPQIASYLRTNLVEPNNAVLFFAVETECPDRVTSLFDGCVIGGTDLRSSFRDDEYHALKHMIEVSNRPALREEVFHRENETWPISYVWNSGTFVQYYQVWKAWLLLLEYERTHGVFDMVVRWRTDVILTRPMILSKFTTTEDEYTCRSMGDPIVRETIPVSFPLPRYEHPYGHPWNSDVVWTLGCEQTWMAKRSVFALLGPMVYTFGCWDSGRRVAFCSEEFFQEFCKANHITHWGYIEKDHTLYTTFETREKYLWSIVR